MAYTYEVTSDIVQSDGTASLHPAWCVVVIRFRDLVTLSRISLDKPGDASIPIDPDLAAATKPHLIISSDCVQLSTSTNKNNHVSTMSVALVNSQINYMAEVMPGDWICAWMAQDAKAIESVVNRLKSKQACNRFNDGLKFVGRVQSVREAAQVDPTTGKITLRTHVQGCGFKEFDSSIFYEPLLAEQIDITTWLGRLGKAFNEFVFGSAVEGGISVNIAIPSLLNIILGEGLPTSISAPADLSGIDPSGRLKIATGSDAPYAYVVPNEVGAILGKTAPSKQSGVFSYADLLDLVIGIQRYTARGSVAASASNFVDVFSPDSIPGQQGRHKTTGTGLSGIYFPKVPELNNKPFWQVLAQYLNPAVNEMYTCLRADSDGNINPHLIVRQLPFTTPLYTNTFSDDSNVTPFLELPRWKITPAIVYSYDLGRSNALRFNFIHCYGQPLGLSPVTQVEQLINYPPVRDSLDIKRNGLFADTIGVACAIKDVPSGDLNSPARWIRLRGDFQMGLNLTLNGTIITVGIQAPIVEGDNLEFNGAVYHIESVTHNGFIDNRGNRSFLTTLTVTHGIRADQSSTPTDFLSPDSNMSPDTQIYYAIRPEEPVGVRPGLTYEGNDKPPSNRSES